MNPEPTAENIQVRLNVKASFSLTLGLYSGPLTKKIIAENLNDLLSVAGGIESSLDSWTIEEVIDEPSGKSLAESNPSAQS